MPYVKVGKRFIHYWAPRPVKEAVGQVVLMVHGAYDCQDYWKHVYANLKASHTPIAIDLPGRGGSDGPPLSDAKDFVRFFTNLLKALKLPPFVFLGHSMGGTMAVDYASRAPQRVKAVIALSSAPDWKGTTKKDIAIWNTNPDKAFRDNLPALFAKDTPIAVKEFYDAQLRETPPLSCRADIAACRSFDTEKRLKKISCPTLVVTGDEEAWIEGSHRLAKGIKGARIEFVPKAGHAIALEQPQKLTAVVARFLSELG